MVLWSAALLALARRQFLETSCRPLFYVGAAWLSVYGVVPTALATLALVGPAREHSAQFAALAGTDNHLGFTTLGAAGVLWWTFAAAEAGHTVRNERNRGTLGSLWVAPAPRLLQLAAWRRLELVSPRFGRCSPCSQRGQSSGSH